MIKTNWRISRLLSTLISVLNKNEHNLPLNCNQQHTSLFPSFLSGNCTCTFGLILSPKKLLWKCHWWGPWYLIPRLPSIENLQSIKSNFIRKVSLHEINHNVLPALLGRRMLFDYVRFYFVFWILSVREILYGVYIISQESHYVGVLENSLSCELLNHSAASKSIG